MPIILDFFRLCQVCSCALAQFLDVKTAHINRFADAVRHHWSIENQLH